MAAAGLVPVAVQLTTPQGEPFGSPGELTVRSSAYADAARILVRAALGAPWGGPLAAPEAVSSRRYAGAIFLGIEHFVAIVFTMTGIFVAALLF